MPTPLRKLKTTRTLAPGQPGTKKLVSCYGSELVCVRYRYDATRQLKHKTVEVIVDTTPYIPRKTRLLPETMVSLRVQYGEIEIGKKIKAAGGKWNARKKVWEIPYQKVVALGLTDRIVNKEENG
jgi:hypothetical protein